MYIYAQLTSIDKTPFDKVQWLQEHGLHLQLLLSFEILLGRTMNAIGPRSWYSDVQN